MSRPVVTSGGITLPRAHTGGAAPGTTGVTVFRSDGGVSNPPAAHSGGVAVTTTHAAAIQHPPAAHIAQPSLVGQQPPPALKAEQISKFLEYSALKAEQISKFWESRVFWKYECYLSFTKANDLADLDD